MRERVSLTILTPTYNRIGQLSELYDSLRSQTNQNFQWLIIDDGSTDGTQDVIETMLEHDFKLNYYRKNNGGKHSALNYAHPYIDSDLVCIVDSDDTLIPRAVEAILERANEFFENTNVKCITFLRGNSVEAPICKSFPDRPVISNHIDFRLNEERVGDCFEILQTEVLKEFPFPEYPGETFMGEGYLWNSIGFKYDTVYIPEVIYICNYRSDGLTRAGRKLRIQNPHGGMANSNSYFGEANGRRVHAKLRAKEAILLVCYGKFAGMNHAEILSQAKCKQEVALYYLLGLMLNLYWSFKYK